jgi:transcriptional regulator with XRE-family HTH domain
MDIGNNLRVIRNKRDFSHQDVADFLGVDRKTYASWEAGEADVKGVYIPKLAEFLQVEIKDLFREKTGDIVINQRDNKDTSINNCVVFLIADKEIINQLVGDVLNKRLEKQ